MNRKYQQIQIKTWLEKEILFYNYEQINFAACRYFQCLKKRQMKVSLDFFQFWGYRMFLGSSPHGSSKSILGDNFRGIVFSLIKAYPINMFLLFLTFKQKKLLSMILQRQNLCQIFFVLIAGENQSYIPLRGQYLGCVTVSF